MECNWNSKLAFLIINTFFVTTGCFLNTRIYSLDSFNNSPSLKIEGLTINENIQIYSGNVSNYLLSGVCNNNEKLMLTLPVSKEFFCSSNSYSIEVDLTSIIDGSVDFRIQNEAATDSISFTRSKDVTPPTNPTILDYRIAWNSLSSTPKIFWSKSTDAGSGFDKYQYSIGSMVGISDIVSWTDNSVESIQILTGISLTLNTDYFFNIKAFDKYGNVSSVMSTKWRTVSGMNLSTKSSTAVNWNDYYKTASVNTPCDGSETRATCSHGGEEKFWKVVDG